MEELLESLERSITEIASAVDTIVKTVGSRPVSKQLRDAIQSFIAFKGQYEAAVELGDMDKISDTAKMLGVYGQMTAHALKAMGNEIAEADPLSQGLLTKSTELRKLAENNPASFKPLTGLEESSDNESKARIALQSQAQRRGRQLAEELDKQEQRVLALHKDLQDRFQTLDTQLTQLDSVATKQIKKIEDAYNAATTALQAKKKEADDILGIMSGNAIAGDYEKSAVAERKMADWLRYASLGCMLLIAGLLGYTFWETTQDTFSWEKSAFRILAAVFLSAPAAYLARESSKHRHQQYAHLQTSLDLKALSPYVASLPEEIQHKIKSEVASRVFSGRDFSKVGDDTFPINAQEIVLKVIDKIDFSRNEKKR